MRHHLMDETNGRRTFVVALEMGEEEVEEHLDTLIEEAHADRNGTAVAAK